MKLLYLAAICCIIIPSTIFACENMNELWETYKKEYDVPTLKPEEEASIKKIFELTCDQFEQKKKMEEEGGKQSSRSERSVLPSNMTSESVVTRTVEKTGGVRTTTTTFRPVTKDGLDSALSKLGSANETDGSANETDGSAPISSGKQEKVDDASFEDHCLKAHNEYRVKHAVPTLVLSKEMSAYSKEWADHLAATNSFEHRTQDQKYGENLFTMSSSHPNDRITGNEAVDSWYSEIKDYVFGKEPTSLKSGHFTQVVWKESKSLGCAWARSQSGGIIVVANYDPAGNFIGKFAQNVPAPL